MKHKLIFTLILAVLIISGCAAQPGFVATPETPIGMPNPASVHCADEGGKVEIRDEAGGEVGYCIFPDGSECEEWAFFRGECAPGMAQPNEENVIRIGMTAPLSGPASESGTALRQGAEMAVQEVNAAGGIELGGLDYQVELLVEDSESKPDIGVAAAEKLITQDKVHYLIGDALHSSVTMAIMELAPEYGIPIVSGESVSEAIVDKVTADLEKYHFYWKMNFGSTAYAHAVFNMVEWLMQQEAFQPQTQRVFFIVEDTDYGRSNADVAATLFEQIGWSNAGIEAVPLEQTDFAPQLEKLQDANADILISIFTPLSSGMALVEQLDDLDLRALHIAIYYPNLPGFAEQVGAAAEGLLWTPLIFDPKHSDAQHGFAEKVQDEYDTEASYDYAFGYDALSNAVDSINRAGSLAPDDIVTAVASLDRQGVVGRYVFDPSTHEAKAGPQFIPIPIAQVQGGQSVTIWPEQFAIAEYQPQPTTGQQTGAEITEVTQYDKGYRFEQNGWIYLHIEGRPHERGFQHGYLLAPELDEILHNFKELTYWDTGKEWEFFVEQAVKQFAKRIDPEYLKEIKGIAAGAQAAGTDISWQDVLTWNGYEELLGYWWPNEMAGKYAQPDDDHCSAFIATGSATKDGKIVMAHNSWDAFTHGQYLNVILDIEPAKGHRMFMQSAPGYIASFTDFFVTDAGIMGTETTIGGYSEYDPDEDPEFFRIRKSMQYADTLDEFVKLMEKKNNGGYANSWLLADINTGEIMRFELGLQYQNVERTKDGYFVGFNAATDPRIRNLETSGSGYDDIRMPSGARRVRLTQLMEEHHGQIDAQVGQEILADHYDVYLQKENPGSRTVEGRYDLDAFEYWPARIPFAPQGAVDGKVMDSDMANDLSFWARWGSSSGMPFDADKHLSEHPQWDHLADYLKDRPTQPWTFFSAEEGQPESAAAPPPALPQPAEPITARMLVGDNALMGPGPSHLNWSPVGATLAYVAPDDGQEVLWIYEAMTGDRRVLLDPTSSDVDIDITSALWSPQGDAMLLTGAKGLYLLDVQTGRLRMVTDGDEIGSVTFLPSGTAASFVLDNDLYIVSFEDGQTQRLTDDGSKTVYNDALDWVYTEEMATRAAQPAGAWSPDSRWMISLHLDDEEVGSHPIMDYRPIPSTVSTIRFPTAGSANPKASLRMFGFEDGKSTQSVQLPEDAEYILPLFTWSPDSAEALYMTVSRDHKVLELKAWNPATGEGRTIIEETDPYWINEYLYAPPVFLADGQRFLWLSERDGFMHLYEYDLDGTLIRQLTQGNWLVDSTPWDILTPGRPVHIDPSSAWAYFVTTANSPLERQLYRLDLESGQLQQLSQEPGFHAAYLSGDGQYLVDQFSDVATPPITSILHADGSQVEILGQHAGPSLSLPQVTREFLAIEAHDGTDLYAQIVKPEDFDPARKYGVVIHWYGGPSLQLVSNRYGAANIFNHIERDVLYTQAGFIVWRLDNRGSLGRGHAFETPIAGELGPAALDDQLAGVEYLKSLPYVDADRICTDGKSFGGFLTLYAFIHAPDVFRCGVDGSGPTDWLTYDTIYTERYMGIPDENPEGYAATKLVDQVEQFQVRPLLIHGLADTNVHLQNTVNLMEAMMAIDKPFDFVPLPNSDHHYGGDGLVAALSESVDYFLRHIGDQEVE